MLSPTVERKARSHLRLAEGLMKTAEIGNSASEFEIRNAFSRAYYGLFHACYAHLLSQGTDPIKVEKIARDHGRLHSTMQESRGKWFGRFLRDAYERRRESDYNPRWASPLAGAAQTELKRAKTEFYLLFHTTRTSLG
jgi:uncharacterized protein (UPF0332 family)